MGQPDSDSLADCRAATEQHPHDPEIWLKRASLARASGATQEAIDSLFRVADLYARAGMRAQAIGPINHILELDPSHPGARRFRDLLGAPDMALGTGQHWLAESERGIDLVGELTAIGTALERAAGSVIVMEGELAASVYAIIEGTVAVEVRDPRGDGPLRIAELGAGDVFGELAFLMGGRRTATVLASTDVKLVAVSPDALRAAVEKEPRIGNALRRSARRRLGGVMAALFLTVPPFSELSPARRRELVLKLRLRRLAADELLVHRGQRRDEVYFVALGRLEVYRAASGGALKRIGRGDVVQAIAPATASVRALEPSCVFVLAGGDLRALRTTGS